MSFDYQVCGSLFGDDSFVARVFLLLLLVQQQKGTLRLLSFGSQKNQKNKRKEFKFAWSRTVLDSFLTSENQIENKTNVLAEKTHQTRF
jgi:hypothetical protein